MVLLLVTVPIALGLFCLGISIKQNSNKECDDDDCNDGGSGCQADDNVDVMECG